MWVSFRSQQYLTSRQRGFTIVELLIVIVVIGILAAITIVAFNGVQNRARTSAVQSAVSQVGKKIIAYSVQNSDQYPVNLAAADVVDTDVTYQYSVNDPGSSSLFCVTATKSNVSYFLSSTTPTYASGSCPGHGSGGAVAMTNLHINPGGTSTTGYGAWSGGSGNAVSTGSFVSAWSQSGNAFRATWTTVASVNGDLQVGLNAGSTLIADTTYTARFRITTGQNGTISAPAMYASSGITSYSARSHSSDMTMIAGTPVTIWITFQADSTALTSGLRVLINPRAKVANGYYELSEAVVYRGSYNSAIGYVSGATPNWVWNGTPNASTSTGSTPQ